MFKAIAVVLLYVEAYFCHVIKKDAVSHYNEKLSKNNILVSQNNEKQFYYYLLGCYFWSVSQYNDSQDLVLIFIFKDK